MLRLPMPITNGKGLAMKRLLLLLTVICLLESTANAMKHPRTLRDAQRECTRLYGQIHTHKGVWTTASYVPPKDYATAMLEIRNMRAYLRGYYAWAWKDSLQHPTSVEFGLGLILYGDGRQGHQFDHI